MTITLLTLLLISNALSLRTDKPILFSRLVMVSLVHFVSLLWEIIKLTFYQLIITLGTLLDKVLSKKPESYLLINTIYFSWQITCFLNLSYLYLALFIVACLCLFNLFYINSWLKDTYPRIYFLAHILLYSVLFSYLMYLGFHIIIFFIKIIVKFLVRIKGYFTSSWTCINKESGNTTPPDPNNHNNQSNSSYKTQDDQQRKDRNKEIRRGKRAVYKDDKHNDDLVDQNNSPVQLISLIKGYFYVNPYLALSLTITLFSFAGVPPLIGFFARIV